MTQSDLPALAVDALRQALSAAVADLGPGVEVATSSPWRAPELGLFLHLFELAPARDPAQVPTFPTDAPRLSSARLSSPRLSWRLRVLIGAFGPDDVTIHRLIGRALATLAEHPILTPEEMMAAAQRLGIESAGSARSARVSVEDMDIGAMTALWQRFAPMRYSLSLAAQVLIP